MIIGHFGLALAGLAIWVALPDRGLGRAGLAAVGVLLPVAGLGMAALAIGLPGPRPRPRGRPVPAEAGPIRPGGAPRPAPARAGAGRQRRLNGTATRRVSRARPGPCQPERRLSPLIVVGHGALAVTTMLLVLLAALGAAAG